MFMSKFQRLCWHVCGSSLQRHAILVLSVSVHQEVDFSPSSLSSCLSFYTRVDLEPPSITKDPHLGGWGKRGGKPHPSLQSNPWDWTSPLNPNGWDLERNNTKTHKMARNMAGLCILQPRNLASQAPVVKVHVCQDGARPNQIRPLVLIADASK